MDPESRERKRRRLSVEPSEFPPADGGDQGPVDAVMEEMPAPQTPEQQHEQSESASVDAKKITINLRSAQRPLETIPSSPPMSPQPPNPTPGLQQTTQDEDVKISVEAEEPDVRNGSSCVDTPVTASSAAGSPRVEEIPVDEHISVGEEPSVTVLDEMEPQLDPSEDFPYKNNGDTFPDIMTKLSNYLCSHDDLANNLTHWINQYLEFVRNVSHETAYASYFRYQALWQAFPELVWHTTSLRLPDFGTTEQSMYNAVLRFCEVFARLTAHFVELDLAIMSHAVSTGETHLRDLSSSLYQMSLFSITRRDLNRRDERGPFHRDDITATVVEAFQSGCRSKPLGSLQILQLFVQKQTELLPRFPRLADSLHHPCNMVSVILVETDRRLQSSNPNPQAAEQLKRRLQLGFRFFLVVSQTLSTVIDKHITHLGFDSARDQIAALGKILQLGLGGGSPQTKAHEEQYHKTHDKIDPALIPEVGSFEWRFAMYRRLIMSGQMQLRVMAVSTLCTELVAQWKRYGESSIDQVRDEPVVKLFSGLLTDSGLVSYLLGPSCHPEIIVEASNIIGFLAVTRNYADAHTDLLWATVTTTQDPRISDALVRMIGTIMQLFSPEATLYMCRQVSELPIEAFSAGMREFCDQLFRHITKNNYERAQPVVMPFLVCLRLLRASSGFGHKTRMTHPEIGTWAQAKLGDLLKNNNLDLETRQALYRLCLEDIENKAATTMGSLGALHTISSHYRSRDIENLTTQHNLTTLLVDELEMAISKGKAAGYPQVISGDINVPRRELLCNIISNHPGTITTELGPRLWAFLVGQEASCREDRDAAWRFINDILRHNRSQNPRYQNPFITICFATYLPQTPPACFCEGLLMFVREILLPQVNDIDSVLLDDEETSSNSGIEQLWRIILTAPEQTIERPATLTLVQDVYIASKAILAFPPHRARKIHLALASRCLKQLSSAATELVSRSRTTSLGPRIDEHESTPSVSVTLPRKDHELRFIRSLAVLREFHWLYRSNANFAVPDLRSLRLESPGTIKGDSAELKFQSFDGDDQTDIKPLNIGKLNTTGSLLASLRAETGWENYRLYYRGNTLIPRENDICKSLAELRIHDGLILVKREADEVTTLANIRPGASPVEIEILSHFEELWSYLSMEDRLAEEMYSFLVRLPVDERILSSVQTDTVPHQDIFPLGQPFKSLYGAFAIREYLCSRRRITTSVPGQADPDTPQTARTAYAGALARALSLTGAAICDFDVIHSCESKDLQILLATTLLNNMLTILKDPLQAGLNFDGHDSTLLDRLFQILDMAMTARATDTSTRLVQLTFQAMLECASISRGVWDAFRKHDGVEHALCALLVEDLRPAVRKLTAKLISDRTSFTQSPAVVSDDEFRSFLWPLIERLVPVAMRTSSRSEDIFDLFISMFDTISKTNSPVIDINALLRRVSDLLLSYTTYEDITLPNVKDCVAWGLARMVFSILAPGRFSIDVKSILARAYPQSLFWKHLFPQFRDGKDDASGLPRVILHGETRMLLARIIYLITKADGSQWNILVRNLDSLVEYNGDNEDDNPYNYELGMNFDRNKAIRSSCGYVGLRNLSNTCYLNSLFTQLFMNTDFRQFMLNAEIHDDEHSQRLLAQTRNLFGFLQNSYQRFYDPEDCVASIRTYEDTTIDIHNQMDVDEFYNLLFDRWEGQLGDVETKRKFRAFYGGQLVQQVRSKECEHISERLEPFSAIQCDIKGKNSLQESLQAYTSGEIMQGDNKYKCSECDRHVDAVKRACLKDIPNNLIFHLKRFDFNLRTLQRAKINDRFEFPLEIDMQPYTIEQVSSPSEKHEADLFELVGVLVHSGTAESGHYYSYIRQRPSSGDKQVWIEFNDDQTSYWDPAQMQAACYGGETRSNYDINGSSISEKSYSAYMLFYQRSSSLNSVADGPRKCQIPAELATHIRHENMQLVRKHCLYDPYQIPFVILVLENLREMASEQCSQDHDIERRVMHMALGHLDQVASRTKDLPDFQNLVQTIRLQCQRCKWCSLDAYDYFAQGRLEALRQLVQRNPEAEVRQSTGALVILILQTIKANLPARYFIPVEEAERWRILPEEDPTLAYHPAGQPIPDSVPVAAGALMMLRKLWDHFHVSLRSWNEVFGLMCAFVSLGRHEMAAAMDQNYLSKAVQIIIADNSFTAREQPIQFQRLLTTLQRRIAARQPSYENIILLIHKIIGLSYIQYDDEMDLEPCFDELPRAEGGRQSRSGLPLNRVEFDRLNRDWGKGYGNVFVDKLIGLNQNIPSTEAILVALMDIDKGMDTKIRKTLEANISGQAASNFNTPYLRAAQVYINHSEHRDSVQSCIRHVATQCRSLANSEGRSFFDFLREAFLPSNELEVDDPNPDMIIQGLRTLPHWVPGLLAYFEPLVAHEVEMFVQENLFIHGVSPEFSEVDGGMERTEAVDRAARQLGLECLFYVRDHLQRGDNIDPQGVDALQRVVTRCKPYYNFKPGEDDEMAAEFTHLYDNVMEPVRRAAMEEELEEDASDQEWAGSDCSSEQLESLGDISMHAA